jgi:hypothetical protein
MVYINRVINGLFSTYSLVWKDRVQDGADYLYH